MRPRGELAAWLAAERSTNLGNERGRPSLQPVEKLAEVGPRPHVILDNLVECLKDGSGVQAPLVCEKGV